MPAPRMTYEERMSAWKEKRRRVLAFLRTESWTTFAVARLLIGCGQAADKGQTSRVIAGLERDGLVVTDSLENRMIIGVTADGQAAAAGLVGKPPGRVYERGRLPVATLDHRVDLQSVRVRCAFAGWSGWTYPDRIPAREKTSAKAAHRPDALAMTPAGERVAIECERTIKSLKRYRFVVGHHLSQIVAGKYAKVVYACPDADRAAAVRNALHNLGHVVVAGQDKRLTDTDLEKFLFLDYSSVPSLGQKKGA